ncbi:hypothetical protein [Massilia sp. TWR1-2-2]|uniref:hypothetical protein n=1 Tax=Massilia sp. TWR1-2-2 TaxID=2804584 RepID=UPI003CF965FA
MKTGAVIVIASSVLIATLGIFVNISTQDKVRVEDSPAGKYRIEEPVYGGLAKAAQSGDCKAAYRLGRHHVFATRNTNEAIRWYRLASKCPHADAKGELVSILMHFDTADAEVDRLLSEIQTINPEAAETDRAAVESVRALRARQNR